MNGVKISELPLESVLRDTDQLVIARGDTTRRVLGANLIKRTDITAFTSQINSLSTETINVVDGPSIRLNYNSATRTLSGDLSVVPVSKGGTGQTNYLENGLLVGSPFGTLEQRQLSAGPGIYYEKIDTPTDKYFLFTNTSQFTGTNLGNTTTINTIVVQSSTGQNTTLLGATPFTAGVMTASDKQRSETLWNNLSTDTPFNSLERPSLTGIRQALGSFLYVNPTFTFFRINGSNSLNLEVGQTLVNPTLTWNTNKVEPQAITNFLLTRANGLTSTGNHTFTSFTDTNTYTITSIPGTATQQTSSWNIRATDWSGAQTNTSLNVNWRYRVYYGSTNQLNPTSNVILSQSQQSVLTTNKTNLGAQTVTASDEYIFIAYPQRFGQTTALRINGLTFTDITEKTISTFTNGFSGTASYYVYMTNNRLTSTYTIEIL